MFVCAREKECARGVFLYFFFIFFQATATLSRKMPEEGGACRNSVVESKLR